MSLFREVTVMRVAATDGGNRQLISAELFYTLITSSLWMHLMQMQAESFLTKESQFRS